jgi:glutaredoxin 3
MAAAKVKVYTRLGCGYCTAALHFLGKKQVEFEHVDCTNDPKTRDWLVKATGRSTVPQIFIDEKPIGGYDDMNALDKRGELDRMLGR